MVNSISHQIAVLQERKKELHLEINKTLAEKNAVERDLSQLSLNADSLRSEIESLKKATEELSNESIKALDENNQLFVKSLEQIQNAQELVKSYFVQLKDLNKLVVVRTKEVDVAKKQCSHLFELQKIEAERISKDRSDLDVYRSRLEKIRDEIAPEMKIILKDDVQS